MSDKNNKIPFNEDNYTHNINRNNERKLDRLQNRLHLLGNEVFARFLPD